MARPFEYLVRDDFFTEEELQKIWAEIQVIQNLGMLHSPTGTGVAYCPETLQPLKKNRGVFLGEVYGDLASSPFVRAVRKVDQALINEFSDLCFVNHSVLTVSRSSYLLSYYEDGDEYLPHRDAAAATILYWLCTEPQGFTGGNLYFPELDEWVEFKHNRMVMFPSLALHQVPPVKMNAERGQGFGRYCFTQFLLQ